MPRQVLDIQYSDHCPKWLHFIHEGTIIAIAENSGIVRDLNYQHKSILDKYVIRIKTLIRFLRAFAIKFHLTYDDDAKLTMVEVKPAKGPEDDWYIKVKIIQDCK